MKNKWNHHYGLSETCEKCGQKTIVYRREITFPMLHCMRILYVELKNMPSSYTQISKDHRITTDFTKLRYWGLLVHTEESSLYHLSIKGIKFLRGDIYVQRYKWIYNNAVLQDPEGIPNPLIYYKLIKPKRIDKESILADSMSLSRYIQMKTNGVQKQEQLF